MYLVVELSGGLVPSLAGRPKTAQPTFRLADDLNWVVIPRKMSASDPGLKTLWSEAFSFGAILYHIEISISEADWIKHPEERWNAGLERAGLNFRQGLQRGHYPSAPAKTRYVRTYQVADKANFNITEPGKVMEFGSVSYLQFLLVPTRTVANWAGKREELTNLLQQGLKSGISDFHGGA